jgi:lipopolysaccharide export system protein LptA
MANLKRFWTMSLACASLILCGEARAQPAPAAPAGATDVSSDKLVRYDAEHRAVYSGQVEAVMDGGRTRLTCDTLTVFFYGPGEGPNGGTPAKAQPAANAGGAQSDSGISSGNIKQMLADGHVFYVTQNETARGDHGIYDAQPDTITLTGGVIMVQGKNVLRADKLVMDRKSGLSTVSSNATGRNNPDRVRSVIYNDSNQTGQSQPGQSAQGQAAQGQNAAKAPAAPAKKP